MRTPYQKIFKDKTKLQEALLLMDKGEMTISAIARQFGVDHTTLLYHARQHGIKIKSKEGKTEKMEPKPLTEDEFWKGINRGKEDYQAYRDAEKAKKERLLWEK